MTDTFATTLTPAQQAVRQQAEDFGRNQIAPYANQWDQAECFPPETIGAMANAGYLGQLIPEKYGGQGAEMVGFGLLNEQIGRFCSSARSLITVHSMVSYAINRWGRGKQREQWLPAFASGEKVAAFALSEPLVGSDANVQTTATKVGDTIHLNGQKKWTTFAEIADIYLVFASLDGNSVALLVERDSPGLLVRPMRGLLGTRASMVAELQFEDVAVPVSHMLAGPGFGVPGVALSALNIGRFTVAWGCVGIGQACLDASVVYSAERTQFDKPLKNYQLIQRHISNMATQVQAARLLCHHAGQLIDQNHPQAVQATLIAKYFASTMAMQAALDAVQIHGGNGCSSDYPVQRYLRDAKIMEIIEGSNEMQQVMIADGVFQGG